MDIAVAEQIPLTEGGARLIARLADGAMRDALSMLDRTAGCDPVDEDAVSRSVGILGANDATELMACIRADDLGGAVQRIGQAYDSGRDLGGRVRPAAGADSRYAARQDGQERRVGHAVARLFAAEVQRLCEGVAASTLIAWSRILQESQGRLKNRSQPAGGSRADHRAAVHHGRGCL